MDNIKISIKHIESERKRAKEYYAKTKEHYYGDDILTVCIDPLVNQNWVTVFVTSAQNINLMKYYSNVCNGIRIRALTIKEIEQNGISDDTNWKLKSFTFGDVYINN